MKRVSGLRPKGWIKAYMDRGIAKSEMVRKFFGLSPNFLLGTDGEWHSAEKCRCKKLDKPGHVWIADCPIHRGGGVSE